MSHKFQRNNETTRYDKSSISLIKFMLVNGILIKE